MAASAALASELNRVIMSINSLPVLASKLAVWSGAKWMVTESSPFTTNVLIAVNIYPSEFTASDIVKHEISHS